MALVVSGATAPWIAGLIADPSISLMSMREAHALSRRHPYLDEVELYRGVVDLAAILPREDVGCSSRPLRRSWCAMIFTPPFSRF